MKLNPPETAPKNEVILADFGEGNFMPAIWNPADRNWSTVLTVDTDPRFPPQTVYFEDTAMEPRFLRGWLPMPQIDDQGNVR